MRLLCSLLVLLAAVPAVAEEDTLTAQGRGCKDLPSLNRMPGSRIENCWSYVWNEFPMKVGPKDKPQTQIVAGSYQHIIYAQDPKQSALEVIKNYENAFKAAGWKTVHLSGSGKDRTLTLNKDEGGKKLWANVWTMETNDRIWAMQTTMQEQPLPRRLLPENAGPPKGKTDHAKCPEPLSVRRMAGATLYECDHKDYDELEVITGKDGEDPKKETVEGRTWKMEFNNDPTTSSAEVVRTYEDALKAQGFQIVYLRGEPIDTDQRNANYLLAAAIPGKANVEIELYNADDYYKTYVRVVESKDFEQKLQVNAAALMEDLRKNGHVAVYGINFDTGKSTLTKDSEKVLGEVLKLLQDNPAVKLRIEGHTDNVGKPKDNLKLSKARAAAVVDWLTKKGVAKGRLASEGFGDTKPVADNKDEAGRAKNRRVELANL